MATGPEALHLVGAVTEQYDTMVPGTPHMLIWQHGGAHGGGPWVRACRHPDHRGYLWLATLANGPGLPWPIGLTHQGVIRDDMPPRHH